MILYEEIKCNLGSAAWNTAAGLAVFSYLAVIRMQWTDIDQTAVAKLCLTSHKSSVQLRLQQMQAKVISLVASHVALNGTVIMA